MGFIRTFSRPCQFWGPSMWAAPCQLSQCFLADARLPDIGTGTRPEWKVSFPGRMLSPCFGLTVFTTPPSPVSPRPRTLLPVRNPGLRTASYQLCVFSDGGCPPVNERGQKCLEEASPSVVSCLDSCSKPRTAEGTVEAA